MQRTKYEYGGAFISDDGSTYMPISVYYNYTDDFGNYSVSLNTLGFDVYVTAYATGSSAGSTDASVTVYQDGGVVRQYENFVYLSNPSSKTLTRNHTITPPGTSNEDKEITRSFEICQAIIKGSEYVKEMRNGIDTPHVNVIFPSGLATNVGGGRAAYFSIPSPTIYIPNGAIDWNTLYHEYGHHIGMKLGIDDHPAQNLELHLGWPPLVFDLDYDYSMFNSTTYSSYSKSQHIRITWAEAYAYYLSMMIRHYYLEDFNGIAGRYIRYFSITGGVDEGEASVPAIQSVLWCTYKDILNAGRNINDIATGSSSTKIAIKNTHKVMWNILSNSQTNSMIKSFSTYADYFTNNYPEHRSEFGRISAIHGMSPTNVTFSTYSESVSPTINWQNSFISTNYEVNNYSLVFYNNSNEEILQINDINTTSYKLSNADWIQVKTNFGDSDHINIHVFAFQTNTPTTGGFISQEFQLSCLIYTPINNGDAFSITGTLNKQFTGFIKILDEYYGKPVTQIGDFAFVDSSLVNIFIPSSIANIGSNAFLNCSSLEKVVIQRDIGNITSLGSNAFSGCSSLETIEVPIKRILDYVNANNWSNYASYMHYIDPITSGLTIDSVEGISQYYLFHIEETNDYNFYHNCENIVKVTIYDDENNVVLTNTSWEGDPIFIELEEEELYKIVIETTDDEYFKINIDEINKAVLELGIKYYETLNSYSYAYYTITTPDEQSSISYTINSAIVGARTNMWLYNGYDNLITYDFGDYLHNGAKIDYYLTPNTTYTVLLYLTSYYYYDDYTIQFYETDEEVYHLDWGGISKEYFDPITYDYVSFVVLSSCYDLVFDEATKTITFGRIECFWDVTFNGYTNCPEEYVIGMIIGVTYNSIYNTLPFFSMNGFYEYRAPLPYTYSYSATVSNISITFSDLEWASFVTQGPR